MTVFLGALTRTIFGFGEAVVSMPLLALLPLHLPTAVALMGLVSLTVAAVTVTTGWQHIHRRELGSVVLAALLGIPVGLWMVTSVSPKIVTGLLGAALIVYGTFSLSRARLASDDAAATIASPRWGVLLGFASGVFGSAYNFTGIPVAIYGSFRRWQPRNFRSTLQAYFLIAGTLIVAGQGLSGMWSPTMGRLYLWSLPAIALALVVGTRLQQRIPATKFHRYVYLLVTALGTLLLVRLALHLP
nr:sulfite exporter TauE/SafE family protein [Sulfobacillus harzensis]